MGLVYSEPACQASYEGDLQQLYGVIRSDGGQLNVQEEVNGDTPLIAACRRGNVGVVRYLLANGADARLTNQKQRTCLHYVSRSGLSLMDFLLVTLLMPILLLGYFLLLQKQRHNVSLMKEVLKSNVDVNAVDYKGNSALHYVCLRKSRRLLPLLLERRADASIRNHEGETPLDIATRLKFKQMMELLKSQ